MRRSAKLHHFMSLCRRPARIGGAKPSRVSTSPGRPSARKISLGSIFDNELKLLD